MKQKLIRITLSLIIVLSTIMPSILFGFADKALAANSTPKLYEGGVNKLDVQGSTISGIYRRVDETATVNPVLGLYRYPTLYDGGFGEHLLDESKLAPENDSIRSTHPFPDEAMGDSADTDYRKNIAKAIGSQKYYHLVPNVDNPTTARNIIDPDLVGANNFVSIYGGAEKHYTEVPQVFVRNIGTGEIHGNFFYVGDLAREAGGIVDNANNSDEFNKINPTWLRIVRTSYPTITNFKFANIENNEVKLNDTVKFNFDGFEYAAQYKAVNYWIKVNGQELETGRLSTTAAPDPAKPNEEYSKQFKGREIGQYKFTKEGTYTFQLYLEDDVERHAVSEFTVTIGEDDSEDDNNGKCKCEITVNPTDEIKSSPKDMEADPEGEINEDDGTESDIFDVMNYSIPTDEYLDVWGETERYLSDFQWQKYEGQVKYTITIDKTYNLRWSCGSEENPRTCRDNDTITKSYTDMYDFSFWQIGHLVVYRFDDFEFENYALPNMHVVVVNDKYDTNVEAIHSKILEDHLFPKDCDNVTLPSKSVNGGDSRPSRSDYYDEDEFINAAKLGSRIPEVQNDFVEMETSTTKVHMDNKKVQSHAPTPTAIPKAGRVDLDEDGYYIEATKVNNYETESSITANYELVIAVNQTPPKKKSFTNNSDDGKINTVTVHTPVVMYARSSDDKAHDQRINPPIRSNPTNSDTERHAYILDRPFTVYLPTNGQHLNYPGYGNRDYSKYYRLKQVKFPFDVYTETKQGYYPANTWINVPVDMEAVTFFMPVWVPEGQYTVDYRAFAINSPTTENYGGNQHHANTKIPNSAYNIPPAGKSSAAHYVTDSIEVDVVGRLYDFHITDITDYNWKDTFREADGLTPTGNSYWVGQKGIDGQLRGNSELFTLPIHHGSNPNGIKNLAVKTGYTFRFDFKTKGDMQGLNDAIRITPTFYYVSKDGSNRQEVDLYYHDDDKYFIKIGSEQDQTYRTVALNETLRNVPTNEITNNALHYFDFADRFKLEDLTSEYYRTSFARYYQRFMSKEDVLTGPYGWQILNWKLRTYRGPLENQLPNNTMIPKNEIVTKEQTWYGEYSLPAKTYVVAKGTNIANTALLENLNENHPIFLKDGYIIVNFNIETIQEGDLENPYLDYFDSHYMSQWTDMEGFENSFVDGYGNTFNLIEGDVIFYHADQSSLNDFQPSVTH